MLQCIEEELIHRREDRIARTTRDHMYENVLIKELQVNKIYGRIDDNDNDKLVILGVLQSNAQCGYADGIMINPTHRCIFISLTDGKSVKIVKRWNDYLVELKE